MYRIDGATASSALAAPTPVSGAQGFFTDGNPGAAVPPTTVPAEWFNMVQEEIAAVILAAGIGLAKNDRGQLSRAIAQMISGSSTGFASDGEAVQGQLTTKAVTPHSGAALVADRIATFAASLPVFATDAETQAGQIGNKWVSPHGAMALVVAQVTAQINALVAGAPGALNTLKELADAIGDDANFAGTMTAALAARALSGRQIGAAGLATGGGDLTADRTISVNAASAGDLQGAANGSVALTPASWGGLPHGYGTPGYQMLPGGVLIQWGFVRINPTGSSNIQQPFTYPVAFPNNPWSIVGNGDAGAQQASPSNGWNPLSVTVINRTTSGAIISADSCDFDHKITNALNVFWIAIGN